MQRKRNNTNFFCLLLHAHIPYVKKAGVWPFGEEWLLEGMLETYIPLVRDLIYGLILPERRKGKDIGLTLGITPVLADQLSDDYFKIRFIEFTRDKIRRAKSDIDRFSRSRQMALESLARWYARILESRLEYFESIKGDLIKEIRLAAQEGAVEVITSAATHSYLPLLARDSSIYAQVKTGIDFHTSIFGMKPQGFWLPECAYRSRYYMEKENGEKILRKGLDEYLAMEGIRYFFVDTHAVEGGMPPESYTVNEGGAKTSTSKPLNGNSSLRVYRARSSGVYVLARHRHTGMLVWSADVGYPGDGDYREFHKKDSVSGLQYWRVTSKNVDLGGKEIYNPAAAMKKVLEHSLHFKNVIETTFKRAVEAGIEQPLGIVAPYDAELYGHWWGEGINWLSKLFSHIIERNDTDIIASTVSEYINSIGKTPVIDVPESSWGSGGGHYIWFNQETRWMWELIKECEDIMIDTANIHYNRSNGQYDSPMEKMKNRILAQMVREKFLLESSDWEFLVTTAQARQYAQKRFLAHYNRFKKLRELFLRGNGNNKNSKGNNHVGRFSDDEIRFIEAVSATDSIFRDKIEPRYFLL